MQSQSNSQKKPSRKKYIFPTVIILSILAGYIYKVIIWIPVDSESKKQSEAMIRQTTAEELNIQGEYSKIIDVVRRKLCVISV